MRGGFVPQTLTTGTVVGTATDSSGAIVHGATVTLEYPSTGDSRTALTGEDGQYRFPLLKPGAYRIWAESPGLTW